MDWSDWRNLGQQARDIEKDLVSTPEVVEFNEAYYGRSSSALHRLYKGACAFSITDIADQLILMTNAIHEAMNVARSRRKPSASDPLDELDADEIEDLAYTLIHGTRVMICLHNQFLVPKLIPMITRNSASVSVPWEAHDVLTRMKVVGDMYFPEVVYTIADYLNPLFQIIGSEKHTKTYSGYVLPIGWTLTATEFDDLLETYKGFHLAGNAAKAIGIRWTKFKINRVVHKPVIPYESELGSVHCGCFPVEDDATITDIDFDAAINMNLNQKIGGSDLWEAAALLRDVTSASTPAWINTVPPAANKQSFVYYDMGDLVSTDMPDTDTDLNFLGCSATNQAATQVGAFAPGNPYVVTLGFGGADADAWNSLLTSWIAKKMFEKEPIYLSGIPVLTDIGGYRPQSKGLAVGTGYVDPRKLRKAGSKKLLARPSLIPHVTGNIAGFNLGKAWNKAVKQTANEANKLHRRLEKNYSEGGLEKAFESEVSRTQRSVNQSIDKSNLSKSQKVTAKRIVGAAVGTAKSAFDAFLG